MLRTPMITGIVLLTINVALFSQDGTVLLDTAVATAIGIGDSEPGGVFELTPDQWGDGIRIVVDDDGTGIGSVDECDEGNNVLEIASPVCP
jgi:hypothetical protein